MSGSEDIVRQFSGQIPGMVTGQNSVAKVYVDDELAVRDVEILTAAGAAADAQATADTGVAAAGAAQGTANSAVGLANNAQVDITGHKASAAAHSAAAIVYSGPVAAANTKEAIDTVNQRVSTIVAGAGASNTEILDARQPATGPAFPILGDRLNNTDAQLADIAINVKSFGAVGNGVTDDTSSINAAISYLGSFGGGTLSFPDGTFMINTTTDSNNSIGGIALIDNINVLLSPNTVLKAIPNSADRYNVISIWNKKNITITGGTIQGDRATHTGVTGEWGYGISCKGSQNVVIRNVTLKDCWGDGYIIGGSLTQPSKNVYVEKCISDNNRRQGLTIAWVESVTVLDCDFSNTNGTAPQAGLDIEPDSGHTADKVIISYCRFYNNAGNGFLAAGIGTTEATSRVKGVKLSSNYSYSNGLNGFHFTNAFDCNSSQNTAYSNSGIGFVVGGGGGHIFSDSVSYSNTTDGIRFSSTVKPSVIKVGRVEKNGQFGLSLVTSVGNTVSGFYVNDNGYHGIAALTASHSNDISSNTLEGNGTSATDTYSNIKVYSNSDYNNIQNNTVRVGVNTNKPKYGIEIADSTSDRNFVSSNYCRLSGNVGGIFNSGSNTNFGAGNINNDGTFSTTPN